MPQTNSRSLHRDRLFSVSRGRILLVTSPSNWPDWWHWEVECSNPHLVKRMVDRSFNETDLREMLQRATSVLPDTQPGRWAVVTSRHRDPWIIIVEPVEAERLLVVVTAYPTNR